MTTIRQIAADGVASLIDCARSSAKRPDLALTLVATCRFHIGTSSGLSPMPVLFDRPVLFTNWLPLGDEVWSRRSLFLFKRVHSFADGPLGSFMIACDRETPPTF